MQGMIEQRKHAYCAIACDDRALVMRLQDAAVGLNGWASTDILRALKYNFQHYQRESQAHPGRLLCPGDRPAALSDRIHRLRAVISKDSHDEQAHYQGSGVEGSAHHV